MSTTAHYLSLAAAAKTLPGRPHPSALWRWARRGLRARDGRRIRLRHLRFGGRLYVTPEALEQFGLQLAEADVAGLKEEKETTSE